MINLTAMLAELNNCRDIEDNLREMDSVTLIELKRYDGEIKKSTTHLDNQKFIQQKMQGKRRTY